MYTLTELGRKRFDELLRTVLHEYNPIHSGIEIAVIFLTHVPGARRRLLCWTIGVKQSPRDVPRSPRTLEDY